MQQTRVDSAFSRSRGSSTLFTNRPPIERLVEELEQEPASAQEEAFGVDRRHRSHLQPPRPNMDWSDWAARSQRIQERLASTLQQLIWGSIGALTGTALAATPVLFESVRTGYPFVLYQPLGAAVGATFAICTLAIFGKGNAKARANSAPPTGWTTGRPDRMR